jgi:hypothetical protein
LQRNDKVLISPLQTAWNKWHAGFGAPVFILVGAPKRRGVKLFSGSKAQELRNNSIDSVPGLYEGSLKDLELWSAVRGANSQTP